MLDIKSCINVYSDFNEWIDFCVMINSYEDTEKSIEIIKNAYDEWFESEITEPISEHISNCLSCNDINHEIYFRNI